MKSTFVLLVILGLTAALLMPVNDASAVTYEVGVETGQWATYSVLGGWDVSPANVSVSMPQAIRDARNTESINMSVESAFQKTVMLARTTRFKNNTRTVTLISGNVETGAGTLNLTVVSRGLEVGDSVTNAPTASAKIKLSDRKTYANAERVVNYSNITEFTIAGSRWYEFRWDKATGILVAMRFFQEDRTTDYAAVSSIIISMTSTSMWEPEGSNPFSFVLRFGSEMVVVGVFVTAAVLAGYAVFRKPKKGRVRRR
ncbi:MAG TPA: hypothetical protein VJ249_10575 [Candidatus Bathyarchaeia archaeon]|nr:hypothetical protein [Candidatus Bathyarchaeia archaeon]